MPAPRDSVDYVHSDASKWQYIPFQIQTVRLQTISLAYESCMNNV